jgi:hypothetical protein
VSLAALDTKVSERADEAAGRGRAGAAAASSWDGARVSHEVFTAPLLRQRILRLIAA